jgi:predicted homoserine dehydrogenase-like protein
MDLLSLYRAAAVKRLSVGIVGVGEFGASLLFRSGRAHALQVRALADRDTGRAVAAAQRAGIGAEQLRVVDSRGAALDAHRGGLLVIVPDAALLVELPLDFVVEATGDPESAARTALAAIEAGRHVAMVTKECDCVVGPILQAKAKSAGLVYTAVDGDQPALLVALAGWARLLGLDIVCAGKSGEYDFVFDVQAGTVTSTENQRCLAPAGFAAAWAPTAAQLVECAAQRGRLLAGFSTATVPDLCELTIVANATGLKPDTPCLHAPIVRTLELPNLFRPRQQGGLLGGSGRLDMFTCLRRSDELSFAGGVFVVVRCDDADTWRVLAGKGIPTSDDGAFALLHNPVHLLGVEAPASLLAAGMFGSAAATLHPVCDLAGLARVDLSAGESLRIGARHAVEGVAPQIVDAVVPGDGAALPYYMAAGCRLRVDVAAGATLTRAMVDPPTHSTLWRLREEQDRHPFASNS